MPAAHQTPLRVLHVVKSLDLGGTEKVMQSFVTHLPRHRFSPSVFSFADGPRAVQIRQAGIDTHVGPDLFTVLARVRPQVVHLHRAGWPEPELLRHVIRAQPTVVVETNVFGRHDPSPSARVLDRTLFVSQFCATRFQTQTGIPSEPPRYSVLYNPVDTDFFSAHATPDFSGPVLGRISRPDPGKWSRLALDFLPELVKAVPNLRYRIIGAIPEAEAFVREHGLEKNVEFLPPVTTDAELATFLSTLSVLVHANDTGESFGLVIAEAMAAGLPVITHPAQGLRDNAQLELVDHGLTGLVAQDAAGYAQATKTLLENQDLARKMGQKGRDKAQALFRAQDIAEKLANIYDELLNLKGIPRS
ncbi:MAG: glycosyltransferase family 4 protein [Proteobacteria bacterium]|nr:glycosyltransferase family 4 protein [Pseudomonadota bacterium]MBU1612758.1 glycosyltransferase family 4 protein [Pseudomonadota bacterium]